MIIEWGKSETAKDIYMPLTFPNSKFGDFAIHTGADSVTVTNIISHNVRTLHPTISHFRTNNPTSQNNYIVQIVWFAIGY